MGGKICRPVAPSPASPQPHISVLATPVPDHCWEWGAWLGRDAEPETEQPAYMKQRHATERLGTLDPIIRRVIDVQ